MLNIGIVGVGNAGSQVASLAVNTLNIPGLAINSSERDLSTLDGSIKKILIGDKQGAGKERHAAKLFLKESIMTLIKDKEAAEVFSSDILFIVSSTGGGTGSGSAIMISEIIKEVFTKTKIVLIGILPTLKEAFSTQVNSIEYLKELYSVTNVTTYMLYDNNRYANMPSTKMMVGINQAIVDDIEVLMGKYQYPTPYSSIDEKDARNIITTRGRMMVVSVKDIKDTDLDDTTIEDLLINAIKKNPHSDFQHDGRVHRTGLITNLSEKMNNQFDTNIPKVQEFIGTTVEEFSHLYINDSKSQPKSVFLIMSGLSRIDNRISKISDRIEEIQEQQKILEDESELDSFDIAGLNSTVERTSEETLTKDVDLLNIFGKYGVE